MSPEKFRKLAYSELEISTNNIISVMKLGNEQTDRQTRNMILFEVLYKNPRSVHRKFEKDSSSGTGYHNFSNEVRQWTDQQTYKKSEIILKQCTKIPEMSLENLKKIAHLELDIKISVRKWGNEQTNRHTRNLKLFWSSKKSQKCLQKI